MKNAEIIDRNSSHINIFAFILRQSRKEFIFIFQMAYYHITYNLLV